VNVCSKAASRACDQHENAPTSNAGRYGVDALSVTLGPDAVEVAFRLACEQLSQRAEAEGYLLAPAYIPIEYRT
jgi:hypothetical protein